MKAIETKYIPATNTLPQRVRAWDCDGNQVTISAGRLDRADAHRKAAEALRDKMGWTGEMIEGGTKGGSVFVFLPKLFRFTFKFHGRQKGAIGIFHDCEQSVIATDQRAAAFKLYDTHEHITLRGKPQQEEIK